MSNNEKAQNKLDKFLIQDNQYDFPYHYIPHFTDSGNGIVYRSLTWGYEYMCYMLKVKEIVTELNPKSILDVGCGDGRFLGLVKDSVRYCKGVDLSEKAIRFAKAFHDDICFTVSNGSDLNEEFDVVVNIAVLEHIHENYIRDFIKTLINRTKKGGHIVFSIPTINLPLTIKHYKHYTLELFKEELIKSGVNEQVKIVRADYIFKNSIVLNIIMRVFYNRFWFIDFKFLQRVFWNYIWNKIRLANKEDGRHLVIVLQKK